MPNMSGPELIAQLQRRRTNFKVLYISGYTGDDLSTESPQQPRVILQKPFSASLFRDATRLLTLSYGL